MKLEEIIELFESNAEDYRIGQVVLFGNAIDLMSVDAEAKAEIELMEGKGINNWLVKMTKAAYSLVDDDRERLTDKIGLAETKKMLKRLEYKEIERLFEASERVNSQDDIPAIQ